MVTISLARKGESAANVRERSGFMGDAGSLNAILPTAKAGVGALRELPLEWGAENAAVSAWGKSFPRY